MQLKSVPVRSGPRWRRVLASLALVATAIVLGPTAPAAAAGPTVDQAMAGRTRNIPYPAKPVSRAFGRVGLDRPGGNVPVAPGAILINGTYFRYAGVSQRVNNVGAALIASQPQPVVSAQDFHSLNEVSVQGDGGQIVEVGWTVDPGQFGDSRPHLFVFHWVNGVAGCYNGCGFVPLNPGLVSAGMALTPDTAAYVFGIEHDPSLPGWAFYYGPLGGFRIEFGYFPDSLWTSQGVNFQANLVQWFGEVAESGDDATQMGTGAYGGDPGAATIPQFWVQLPNRGLVAGTPGLNMNGYNPDCYSFAFGSPDSYGGPGC